MRIGVYCSSSDNVDQEYFRTAEELGTLIGEDGHSLIYGGAAIGLMGRVAASVQRKGGRVVGVIPRMLHHKKITFTRSDRLIVTRTMRQRKHAMEKRAEAFIGLPGGFGTLEELLEVITLKQLGYHTKPIVFINTGGYFDHLLAQFETMYRESFTLPEFSVLYHAARSAREAMKYISAYTPAQLPEKWWKKRDDP